MSGGCLLSVVVPTYQRCASLQRCVKSLERQTLDRATFDVVVVVDGSTDGTREWLDAYRGPLRLHAVAQSNRGRAAACNAGIGAAAGGLIVLLDDDMEAFPECLAAHLAAHGRAVRRGIVGAVPILPQAGGGRTAELMRLKFERHLARLAAPTFKFGVRDFYTGNFSLPRTLFEEIGRFDESFTQYGNEDLELFVRLQSAGVEIVYDARAAARQWYEKSFAGLARDSMAKGRTSMLLAEKHPEVRGYLRLASYRAASPRWRLLRALLIAGSLTWPTLPERLIHAVEGLDHVRVPGSQLAYELVLDYLYWLGVRRAQHEAA
jgi:glycosyltransferase involved in cell wall biosynthesis